MSIKVRTYKRRGIQRPGRWEAFLVAKRTTGEVIREKVVVPDLSPGRPTSRTAALLWAQQRYASLVANGRPQAPDPQSVVEEKRAPTLSEFAPRFIEWAQTERHKPSEIASKQFIINKHLKPVMGDKPLDELTPLDLQALKTRLKDRKPKTVNNVLAVLSKLLKVALDFGVISTIPISARGRKAEAPEMEFYEFEDYAALCNAAGEISPMHVLVVLLGGDAGLRRGEMLALRKADVDFKRSVLTIRQSEWRENTTAPKGNRSRKVPMTKRLQAVLDQVAKTKSERVLCREDGTPMTAETLKWWMEQIQEKAGLEATGKLHILRHTFCSHLAMKGASAIDIKTYAGHRSLDTTNRYMHLSPSHGAAVIGLLDQRTDAAQRAEEKVSERAEKKGLASTSPRIRGGHVTAGGFCSVTS